MYVLASRSLESSLNIFFLDEFGITVLQDLRGTISTLHFRATLKIIIPLSKSELFINSNVCDSGPQQQVITARARARILLNRYIRR